MCNSVRSSIKRLPAHSCVKWWPVPSCVKRLPSLPQSVRASSDRLVGIRFVPMSTQKVQLNTSWGSVGMWDFKVPTTFVLPNTGIAQGQLSCIHSITHQSVKKSLSAAGCPAPLSHFGSPYFAVQPSMLINNADIRQAGEHRRTTQLMM